MNAPKTLCIEPLEVASPEKITPVANVPVKDQDMSVLALLAMFKKLNVTLWVEKGQLRFKAPKNVLTADHIGLLKKHKPKIIKAIDQAQQATPKDFAPITSVSRDARIPLSSAQQRLWIIDQYAPGQIPYNIYKACELTGPLDVAAISQSVQTMIDRHEVFRTVFTMDDGQPTQQILTQANATLAMLDLQAIPTAEQESRIEALAQAEARQPFDLQKAPLLRVKLIRCGPHKHVLLMIIHHIICDGRSLQIVLKELSSLYTGSVQEQSAALPATTLQFADYAAWEKQQLEMSAWEDDKTYWMAQLAGEIPDFPTDWPRPKTMSIEGDVQHFLIAPELANAFEAFCKKEGVTLYAALKTAFDIALWDYSGCSDLLVGSPVSARRSEDIWDLLGLFVNTSVFRTNLEDKPTFRNALKRASQAVLEAQAHQDLPFNKLVEALRPQRTIGRNPLFQVMFLFDVDGKTQLSMPAIQSRTMPVDNRIMFLDLILALQPTDSGIVGRLKYAKSIFTAETMAQMAQHFQTILETMVAHPNRCINTCTTWTDLNRERLFREKAVEGEQADFGAMAQKLAIAHGEAPLPIPNYHSLQVLDDAGQPVADDVVGNLHLDGPGKPLPFNEANDPSLPDSADHPSGPHGAIQVFPTGHLAKRLGNGEFVLLKSTPDDQKTDGGQAEWGASRHLVGAISKESTGTNDPTRKLQQQLQDQLRSQLPDYMVPSQFVFLNAFPVTPNGKIDRRALPAPQVRKINSYTPPNNETERQLCDIWEELLEQSAIGIRSNFFELGGHSLSSLKLMAKIQNQFGLRLPVTTLFQHGTIEALASLIENQGEGRPWQPLMPLKPTGSQPPLFLAHPATGGTLCYRELASYLPDSQPVFAFEAAGMDGTHPPIDDLVEMAARYIQAMREVQPNGPYFIGGMSSGGLVAFEMAQQLNTQGVNDVAVLLLDSFATICNKPFDYTKGLVEFARVYAVQEGKQLLLDYDQLVGMSKEAQFEKFVDAAVDLGLFEAGDSQGVKGDFEVVAANLKAAAMYVPRPFHGPITLLQTVPEATSPRPMNQDRHGWQTFCPELKRKDIAGQHLTMLYEPHAQSLAKTVEQWLSQTQANLKKRGNPALVTKVAN